MPSDDEQTVCFPVTRATTSTPVSLAEPIADYGLPAVFARWFAQRGWTPRTHQLELLARARAGRSTLLIAPTGAGKTLAGFLPSLVELADVPRDQVRDLHTLY